MERARGEAGRLALIHVGGGAVCINLTGAELSSKWTISRGRSIVFTGASDIGQGSETVIAQIVAEVLGIPIDDVNVINNDTDICPLMWSPREQDYLVAGNVPEQMKIKLQILEVAPKPEEDPSTLDIKNGVVFFYEEH